MTYNQEDHQHFEVRKEHIFSDGVEMVTVFTWFGRSNKSGIPVYKQNLSDLRDEINRFLEENDG